MNKVDIFVLSGIWTAPDFMENVRAELTLRYQGDGFSAQGTLLFPYGDWYLSRTRQLKEITFDLIPGMLRLGRVIGGRKAADAIKPLYRGGRLVIVGHSGGGVAAVHAAHILLAEEDIAAPYVVQIGSPKYPIPASLREHVIYVAATDRQGKWKDPVTRMGSWGGWRRTMRRNIHIAMPALKEVPILGGHADYFRNQAPYLQENVSNLQMTIDTFWRDIR